MVLFNSLTFQTALYSSHTPIVYPSDYIHLGIGISDQTTPVLLPLPMHP
jgi:hypothetical protein